MTLLDDFLLRAALAGLGVALAAAPLGCFVVWRRMAYFGDATAHAGVLGVAIALALGVSVWLGALVMALLMALAAQRLSGRGQGMDSMLGVFAHSALAVGLVTAALLTDVRVDLMAFLFGDILTVGAADLVLIWGGAALVAGGLAWRWSALLLVTLNPDLARASGLNPERENTALTLALAITVAIGIKVVGVLLIAALLIIPPAAARQFARTPEQMALMAAGVGMASACGGLWASLRWDTPAGPSIVCAAAALFALASLGGGLRRAG